MDAAASRDQVLASDPHEAARRDPEDFALEPEFVVALEIADALEERKQQERKKRGESKKRRRRAARAADADAAPPTRGARVRPTRARARAPRRLGGGLDAGRARRARARAGRRCGPLETVRVRPGGVHAVPGNHVVALAARRRRRGPPRAARRPLRRPRAVRAPGRDGAGRGRRRRRRRARDAAARVPAGAARAARRPREMRARAEAGAARDAELERELRASRGGGGGDGGAGGDARAAAVSLEARRRRVGRRGAKRARRAGDAGEEAAGLEGEDRRGGAAGHAGEGGGFFVPRPPTPRPPRRRRRGENAKTPKPSLPRARARRRRRRRAPPTRCARLASARRRRWRSCRPGTRRTRCEPRKPSRRARRARAARAAAERPVVGRWRTLAPPSSATADRARGRRSGGARAGGGPRAARRDESCECSRGRGGGPEDGAARDGGAGGGGGAPPPPATPRMSTAESAIEPALHDDTAPTKRGEGAERLERAWTRRALATGRNARRRETGVVVTDRHVTRAPSLVFHARRLRRSKRVHSLKKKSRASLSVKVTSSWLFRASPAAAKARSSDPAGLSRVYRCQPGRSSTRSVSARKTRRAPRRDRESRPRVVGSVPSSSSFRTRPPDRASTRPSRPRRARRPPSELERNKRGRVVDCRVARRAPRATPARREGARALVPRVRGRSAAWRPRRRGGTWLVEHVGANMCEDVQCSARAHARSPPRGPSRGAVDADPGVGREQWEPSNVTFVAFITGAVRARSTASPTACSRR